MRNTRALMQRLWRHRVLIGVLLLWVGLGVVFLFTPPREIVQAIGVENSYFVTFLLAAVGGVSSFTGTALYAAIATFAAGGAHPLLLGILGGTGIFISNTVFFMLARFGKRSVSDTYQAQFARITQWVQTRVPRWAAFAGVYLYLGFSPFPDDLLMIALVLAGYRYRNVWPLLLVGGISIATVTAYIGNIWPVF